MEEQCNLKWQALLKIFKGISSKQKDAIEQYQQLIEVAKLDNEMTSRQKSGIIERCQYQIWTINNPDEKPFPNSERKEERNSYQLTNANSNGKP